MKRSLESLVRLRTILDNFWSSSIGRQKWRVVEGAEVQENVKFVTVRGKNLAP